MFIYETHVKEFKEIVGFKCHKCGREITDELWNQNSLIWEHECGYGSIFGDGNKITLCLCEDCIKELLGEYLIIEDLWQYLDEQQNRTKQNSK